jgi:hypothetical protein
VSRPKPPAPDPADVEAVEQMMRRIYSVRLGVPPSRIGLAAPTSPADDNQSPKKAKRRGRALEQPTHKGGRPPTLREGLQSWLKNLSPKDLDLSDAALAGIYVIEVDKSANQESVRKTIGNLRRLRPVPE